MDWKNARLYLYGEDNEYVYIKDLAGNLLAKSCTDCKLTRVVERFGRNTRGKFGYHSHCKNCNYKNNKSNMYVNAANRRAKLLNLPNTLTLKEKRVTLRYFNGCALTGDSADLHWDHVIPIAVGHAGTTKANMLPLRSFLNISKSDRNIFEWFYANRTHFELLQSRFDRTIAYLADLNRMTPAEYRDYVYWCHANPREVADAM